MSLNKGAEIVPLRVVQEHLLKLPRLSIAPILPWGYRRVQLLGKDALEEIVATAHDRSFISYGDLSKDFPICSDFADLCTSDVRRYAIKRGLAVRPAFGTLVYTKTTVDKETGLFDRHAINYGVAAFSGKVLYYEPQTSEWIDVPANCQSLDEFRL